jgi:quinol monooxygenase YgiN
MDTLQVTARFPNIEPDKLVEFKKVAAEMLEITKGEPGNLQYDYFLSADQRECVVREAYASSDAVLAHMAGMGDLLPRLMELGGGMNVEVFGTPSPTLLDAAAALHPAIYSYLQGK